MPERDTIQSLLTRRKLTRAIADLVRAEAKDHLATLTPLFQPQLVFGDHVEGGMRSSPTRRADQAIKDVQAAYEVISPAKPFNLRRELSVPFGLPSTTLEVSPVEYVYAAAGPTGTRHILVRRPLIWAISYAGYAPGRLPELLDARVRGEELQRFIVSHLALQQVIKQQTGLTRLFEALHLRLGTTTIAALGELPVNCIELAVGTELPPDDVILDSADLTGMDSFEEVIRPDDIAQLQDGVKERLLAIVAAQASDPLPA